MEFSQTCPLIQLTNVKLRFERAVCFMNHTGGPHYNIRMTRQGLSRCYAKFCPRHEDNGT